MIPGSLLDYYREEVTEDANENYDAANYTINSKKATASCYSF